MAFWKNNDNYFILILSLFNCCNKFPNDLYDT
jgi:hypothetical protein